METPIKLQWYARVQKKNSNKYNNNSNYNKFKKKKRKNFKTKP